MDDEHRMLTEGLHWLPDTRTMSIFGMLNWYYQWHPRATRAERTGYAAVVAELVLKGLAR